MVVKPGETELQKLRAEMTMAQAELVKTSTLAGEEPVAEDAIEVVAAAVGFGEVVSDGVETTWFMELVCVVAGVVFAGTLLGVFMKSPTEEQNP